MAELSESDHRRVSEAIAAVEARSDGEIVSVRSAISDSYHDVALHWALAVIIGTIALFAAFPRLLHFWFDTLLGGWRSEPALGELLTLLLVLSVAKFSAALVVLRWKPLRLALTPAATKQRRVRRRAILLFKAAAERRTAGRTGVLLYLSDAEHRAEIVADEAIVAVTEPDCWAEAMAALVTEVRAGRSADGLIAAIGLVGEVLARHFPKTGEDRNEIPDKLIEL